MILNTSKNKTFEIDFMWGPVGNDDAVVLEMEDSRLLSDIAKDFEGVEIYERLSDIEGDMTFEGYTELLNIQRKYNRTGSKVQISVVKPLKE